jgi:6-carboxyhexanoate--CoA ligase
MDAATQLNITGLLAKKGLANDHVREAMILATKVAAAQGMVAELCWSDDPEYTAGYVASGKGYFRFPHLKEYGNPVGGRVFFVDPAVDIEALTDYLEKQPVLVINGDREMEA